LVYPFFVDFSRTTRPLPLNPAAAPTAAPTWP